MSDRQLAMRWPSAATRWPSATHEVTISWVWGDYKLAMRWPSAGHEVIISWAWGDYKLARKEEIKDATKSHTVKYTLNNSSLLVYNKSTVFSLNNPGVNIAERKSTWTNQTWRHTSISFIVSNSYYSGLIIEKVIEGNLSVYITYIKHEVLNYSQKESGSRKNLRKLLPAWAKRQKSRR